MSLLLASLLLARAPKPLADLPFELIDNHIYLSGSLNGKPVDVLLDSGFTGSMVDTALGTSLGAKRLKPLGASGGGGDPVQAWTVSGLSLALPGTDVRQSIPAMVPLTFADEVTERPFRAVLGGDFFKRYRIEIDYAAARVRIYGPRTGDVPPGAEVLPLRLVDDFPCVEGEIQVGDEPAASVSVFVDTGGGGAVLATNRLVARLGLDRRFADSPELSSALGVGGAIRTKKVRLRSFHLGTLVLSKPIAELQMDAKGINGRNAAYEVSIGGEALRRFTLTLDYPHGRMLLQPNASFAEPFSGGLFGVGFAAKPDGVEVRSVVPASPASEAGIVVGDRILEADGHPVKGLRDVRKPITIPNDLRLRIRHGGVEREVILKPRELVP